MEGKKIIGGKNKTQDKCPRFDNEITLNHLKQVYPKCIDSRILEKVAVDVNKYRKVFKLDTCARKAHFFAQSIQEAGHSLTSGLEGETFNYYKGALLNNDLNNLIDQYWFTKLEVVKPDSDHQTQATRTGIRNTYSFFTLHLMVDNLNTELKKSIEMTGLNKYFPIPKLRTSGELDLIIVKQRLEKYMNGILPMMKFYNIQEIAEKHKKLNFKNVNQVDSFKLLEYDHNLLRKLRNQHLEMEYALMNHILNFQEKKS